MPLAIADTSDGLRWLAFSAPSVITTTARRCPSRAPTHRGGRHHVDARSECPHGRHAVRCRRSVTGEGEGHECAADDELAPRHARSRCERLAISLSCFFCSCYRSDWL